MRSVSQDTQGPGKEEGGESGERRRREARGGVGSCSGSRIYRRGLEEG